MCTANTMHALNGENFIGRTMDFSYPLQPHIYYVPKNYKWINIVTGREEYNTFSFMGMGQQMEGVLAFFDGVNERGFAAAVLYFAGYAQYDKPVKSPSQKQIAAYNVLQYILGNCASVDDFCAQAKQMRVVGVKDPLTQTVAPLHWIVTDRSGKCVVFEQTNRGIQLIENPIGVMANSPDFDWHMTNLRNYTEVSPHQVEQTTWGKVSLKPFGQGGGTVSLPGGYTSPERFVRTSYLKTHTPTPKNCKSAVSTFYQVMKSVTIPKGAVFTARETDDYTQYTSFINTHTCEYFLNTYDNLQIKRVEFPSLKSNGTSLVSLGAINQPMQFQSL